jgi:hypothetical protein
MRKKLGEVLIERRLITPEQLQDALAHQQRHPMRLGAALVARGHVNERQLMVVLGQLLGIPVARLSEMIPEPEALRMVSAQFASEHDLLPLKLKRNPPHAAILEVAMGDPMNFRVITELSFFTNAEISTVLASMSDIDSAIRRHYGARLTRGEGPPGEVRLSGIDDTPEMTILRRGGDEERVNTTTGPIPSPFIQVDDDIDPISNPPVSLPRNDSALLLTDEVSGPMVVEHEAVTEGPLPRSNSLERRVSFDATLGALIDAAGETVTAEAFLELERKFWAVMRILARKNLITADELLEEINQDKKG